MIADPASPRYVRRFWLAVDCFAQALLNYGVLGITISARAGTARRHGHRWGCVLCRMLEWIDPGHCQGAIANDILRAQRVIRELSDES